MARIRFSDMQSCPTVFTDVARVALDECQPLVPSFEAAFQASTAAWPFDGQSRTARRLTVYKNCPLATPEDRVV